VSGAKTGALPAMNEAIFALAFLPGSDGIAAKDALIKARDAVAELIEAAATRLKEGAGQMTEAEHRLSAALAAIGPQP
jgi:hypothetical protein